MRSSKAFSVLAILLLFSAQFLSAQMPGWRTVKDRDGNVFFLDQNLKIHIAADPATFYRIISRNSLEYSFSEAQELLRLHRKSEALYIYKSLRYLSSLDSSLSISGGKATAKINEMSHKEKDRFAAIDRECAVLLVKNGQGCSAHNDIEGYTLRINGTIALLKRRVTGTGSYILDASAFGIASSEMKDGDGFDALVTVNSELFPSEPGTAEHYEEIVRNRSGADGYIREKISRDDRSILYSYKGGSPAEYQGYEMLTVRGRRGFLIKVFAPAGKPAADELSLKVITSIGFGGAY
jgi:hypothetical protein